MLAVHLILALLWTIVIGPLSFANFMVGVVVGFAIIWLCTLGRRGYAYRVLGILGLVGFTLAQLVIANVKVAIYTVSPLSTLQPAVLDVPLQPDSTDLEITLLAGLVTLTPGTFTIDVSPDRAFMRVHAMHAPDAVGAIHEIKDGFERRILAVTR